jgi:[NiFe] hydrogenase assembly HybE family chaperone
MSKNRSEQEKDNPAVGLERFFSMVWRTRMMGLPILNPGLTVEAVGFRPWDGGWLGVVITPWFMSLLWVPGSNESLPGQIGDKTIRGLPAGSCEFTLCREAEFGEYLSCSLFSPMTAFTEQDKARHMALEIIDALFQKPAEDESPANGFMENAPPARVLTRRDLLRGAFANKQ